MKHQALIQWLLANEKAEPGKTVGGYSPQNFRKARKLIEKLA